MLVYFVLLVYFAIPALMIPFREYWWEEEWHGVFYAIPIVYCVFTCCVVQYNLGCYTRIWIIRKVCLEMVRWSIIVTMVYGWWNIYMFTVIHSIIWGWCIIESTYIKPRVTFV